MVATQDKTTQDTTSHQEFANNYFRVTGNPSISSDQNLCRAIAYATRMIMSVESDELAQSFARERDTLKAERIRRETTQAHDPASEVPPVVLDNLKIAIAKTLQWNEKVSQCRLIDSRFGGEGRYTWEATNGVQFEESPVISRFRSIAAEKGIESATVLSAIGYVSPIQLNENESNWGNMDA